MSRDLALCQLPHQREGEASMNVETPTVTTKEDLAAIRHFAGLAMQALIAHDGLTESSSRFSRSFSDEIPL